MSGWGVKNYGYIKTTDDLKRVLDKCVETESIISIDIETGYYGPDRKHGALAAHAGSFIAGFSFTVDERWARYVPIRHDMGPNLDPDAVFAIVKPVFETAPMLAHNDKFEAKFFRKEGIELNLEEDTMVQGFALSDWRSVGLKQMVFDITGHRMTELNDLFPGMTKDQEDCVRFNILQLTPEVVAYGCEDSVAALFLHNRNGERAHKERDGFIYNLEMEIIGVLLDMEERGVAVDWVEMDRRRELGERFLAKYKEEVKADFAGLLGRSMAKLNLRSPKQIREILFDPEPMGLGLPVTKLTKGGEKVGPQASTDEIALTKAAKQQPAVKKLLETREVANLLDRFDMWLERKRGPKQPMIRGVDGRVHADYANTVVGTGRFAASDPAIQQCPKKYSWPSEQASPTQTLADGSSFKGNFRDLLIAGEGCYFLGFDYSQIELRAIAGLAQEQRLMEAFENDEDVHSLTAAMMLGKQLSEIVDPDTGDVLDDDARQRGKTFNFALIYQMGVKSLADRLGIDIEEAKELFASYFANMPAIKSWVERTKAECIPRGYTLSYFKRKWKIWELLSDSHAMFAHGERKVVNAPVQGWAADYMKIAMCRIKRVLEAKGWWCTKVWMVMNQHDALMFEVSQDMDPMEVRAVLLPAIEFPIENFPKIVSEWEFGYRWGSCLKVTDATKFERKDESWQILGKADLAEHEVNPFDPDMGSDMGGDPDDMGSSNGHIDADLDVSDRGDLVADPVDMGSEGELRVIAAELPTRDAWQGFLQLLADNPGRNVVRFRTPEGEVVLDSLPTALDTADAGKISVVLGGGIEVARPIAAVDTASLGEGLLV